MTPTRLFLSALLLVSGLAAACGEAGERPPTDVDAGMRDGGRSPIADSGPGFVPPPPDGGSRDPIRTFDEGADVPATGGDATGDVAENALPFGTVGVRCVDGVLAPYLVMSPTVSGCALHAEAFQSRSSAIDAPALVPVRLPRDTAAGSDEPVVRTYDRTLCDVDGCKTRSFEVVLDPFVPGGAALTGTYRYPYVDEDGAEAERTGPISAGWCDFDALDPPPGGDTPARGLTIGEVSINQGVRSVLDEDGPVTVTPPSDPAFDSIVVAGRRGLLRVTVELEGGEPFSPRDILARLDLGGGDVREQVVRIVGASNILDNGDGTYAYQNTFVFDLDGEDVTTETEYSVSLWEIPACSDVAGAEGTPTFPALPTGRANLGARDPVGALDVVVVPMRYLADGSNRLPNTAGVEDAYRDLLFRTYPVAEVNLTIRDPADLQTTGDPPTPITLSRSGGGWSAFLFACRQLRLADGVDPDTYYYCIADPADTFGAYCTGGCVAGLGTLPGPTQSALRASVGIGYGTRFDDTFIHEIGHNHGRRHTPCGGPAGVDPNFPYSGARLGNYGYDVLDADEELPGAVELIPPNTARDFMSYCGPPWVSDYTWTALFERNVAVETLALGASRAGASAVERWRTITVATDGQLAWTDRAGTLMQAPPGGDPVTDVFWVDPSGRRVRLEASYARFDHLDGGFLHIRDPGGLTGPASLEVSGAGTLPW